MPILYALLFIAATTTAADLQSNGIPMRITGPRTVEIGPGAVTLGGQKIHLPHALSFECAPPAAIKIRDEKHDSLAIFNPKAGGWMKGNRLKELITVECTATGLLLTETVRVKTAAGDGPTLSRGADYEMDDLWATVGRIEAGSLKPDQPVWIDYDYVPCRLDSLAADKNGKVRLVEGKAGIGIVLPPALAEGEVAIANLWFEGKTEKLTEANLYPIEDTPGIAVESPSQAEKVLPKTLAKLKAGEDVTIVAWGDSVTEGGGVENAPELRYQAQFAKRLQERYPKARVRMLTAGWGGRGSRNYLESPRGSEKDFVRDVLEPKPDLVTIEFVNDAYLDEEATQVHYKKILDLLRGNGSEVAIITPHLVRPDWLVSDTMKFDEDPRPYVKGLKRFARENGVALADASSLWVQLWRQGIPYITLEANSINHPDERGHRLFADALMALFPSKP